MRSSAAPASPPGGVAHAAEAAAFAAFASGPDAQRTVVGPTAWPAREPGGLARRQLDCAAHGFFSGTPCELERAWVRPRERWWPAFQLEAGRIVAAALESGAPSGATLAQLDALYLGLRGSAGVSG